MVKNMKHIKLFENWAEELEVPEYLDPTIETIVNGGRVTRTLFYSECKKIIEGDSLILDGANKSVNFVSFSDYDFWKPFYEKITVNQIYARYRLKDFNGMPDTLGLNISDTHINSLKGLEDRILKGLFFEDNYIENLKYCPLAESYNFSHNPLLSLYGSKVDTTKLKLGVSGWIYNVCGYETYRFYIHDSHKDDKEHMSVEELNDPQLNGNIFCKFKNYIEWRIYANNCEFNPWHQCYYDPNNVENTGFLFIPFWHNSENFREKAQEMIENLDVSKLKISDNEELW